ncbi:hypothetical protein [Pseudophaeobacter sp.]|uniref:hypothetical protein n=1 Tax=Pseudophaeobacter sp. TaxID=1971739 RepID=UPI003297BFE7
MSVNSSETPSLGLETADLKACIGEVRTRGLTGIFGRHPEFKEVDLACLEEIPNIARAGFWDVKLDDISAIYDLSQLAHFRISGKRLPIDFAKLASLERLVVEHNKKDQGFSSLSNLVMMNLWHFKVTAKDAFEFELPKNLEEVGIFWSNIDSLKGFGICPNVKKLEISRCRNLQSLGDLKTSFPKLEHLVVDACGRLTADEARCALDGHPNVRHAFAGKQLIISSKSA